MMILVAYDVASFALCFGISASGMVGDVHHLANATSSNFTLISVFCWIALPSP